MSTQNPRGPRPPAVVAVSLVLLLQALGVLAAATGFGLQIGTGALNLGAQVFLVALMAAGGLWIGAVGLGLWRGRPWVRAATVVIELFAVILSISFFSAGNALMGVVFLVPAAVALVLMFSRQVAAYLAGLPS